MTSSLSLTRNQAKQFLKTLNNPFHKFLSLFQTNVSTPQPLDLCVESASLRHTPHLFEKSPQPDLAQCNGLLFDYSRNNNNKEALNLFLGIHSFGLPVDGSTLSCVLKVCGCLFNVIAGRQVHCQCLKLGLIEDVSVGTSLLDMYMKTENVEDGRRVFDHMRERNVVSWTSLLGGYAQNGMNEEVLELFLTMQMEGIKPNPYTFAAVLGALASEGMVEKGVQVHCLIVKLGFKTVTFVSNSLISMYLRSGMGKDARLVFDGMATKNAVTWNCMISGFVTNGLDFAALETFYDMRLAGVKFTEMTFIPLIKLCANRKELGFARQLHCRVLKDGFNFDPKIKTALMVAYSKCSEINDAFKLFSTMHEAQNVVSWTAMISGHLQNGEIQEAVKLFCLMNKEGVKPNDFTYSTILTAQPAVSPFQIHAQAIKANYEKSPSVGTAILDAYVKLGNIEEAAKAFEQIDERDIVAWSAMLAGYAQIGDSEGATNIFMQLVKEGIKPNEFTFSSVINACASPTAPFEQGKQFHAWSIKSKLSDALCVCSALITMYAKRGNIDNAYQVFRRQQERDPASWNSMISGYAQHGHAKKALEIFEEMQRENMEMDDITFIGVISACSHAGLVDEGEKYFNVMIEKHRISPTMQLYSCMVDLYSRAGMLDKAMDIINTMPFPAGATVWRTLLAASRVHRHLELGKLAAEQLISLQPQDSAAYVLLSNIYAAAGNWHERRNVRKLMDQRKVKKEAGYSWIEVKNKTHSFLASDHSHPMSYQIYSKLDEIKMRLKDMGYQPDTDHVLQDIADEDKETILSQHSERLAIVFGLIATPPGTALQIVKNLRVCGDCHTVIKLISLIEGRDIVVRDTNRFHHFKAGSCSCGDYW
ncbi:hypothetical protein ERO13_D07G113000v2 [Gossypium hirsutum]|uniref:Pentatricopeptide repeat-containing protein At2g27610 n=2 Tax=Gossypium TaxID=3633 RepID=A0A1U8PQ15_GOSHI|nr:pentatricopeptide repeat-containing protein At2g27610-like [Gossypium hirsutum]KAG4138092.1 hypothetical protein ERO13_D07G113000v2 [Gossypium hirsutum]TYH62527.1 hypothetical protein ES332_D07G126400v1 [Gossypium tomentosum]